MTQARRRAPRLSDRAGRRDALFHRHRTRSAECVQLEAIMGLMDVIKGMQYGPRGQPASRSGSGTGTGTGTGSTGTGVSPVTMAILGLLAYKAVKSMSHQDQP